MTWRLNKSPMLLVACLGLCFLLGSLLSSLNFEHQDHGHNFVHGYPLGSENGLDPLEEEQRWGRALELSQKSILGDATESGDVILERGDPDSASDSEPPSGGDGEGEDEEAKPEPIETWEANVGRGCLLNELMHTTNDELPASRRTEFKSYSDLHKYGWRPSEQKDGDQGYEPNEDERKPSVDSALEALGLPRLPEKAEDTAASGWRKVAWVHSATSEIGGKEYPATGAYFIGWYRPDAHGRGMIIAASTKSPARAKPSLEKGKGLVPLGAWSDVAALTWLNICETQHQDPKNLKYIMRINIAGDVAEDTIPQIINKELSDLGSYANAVHVKYDDSDKARAAIGFPNGRGVGWLLIQHKERLGDTRHVQDIKVWNSNNGVSEGGSGGMDFFDEIPNMLYTLS